MVIYIDNTDENADWIKWRTDDVQASEDAKRLLESRLVEIIKEATDSFVWDNGWHEPAFIVKGGPGSGHHGHAGRPGSVGGSLSSSGQGLGSRLLKEAEGWNELTPYTQVFLRTVMSVIPEKHLGGISKIDLSEEAHRRLTSEGDYGEYNAQTKTISIARGSLEGSAQALMHEIGHHNQVRIFVDHVEALRTLDNSYQLAQHLTPKALNRIGMRRYALSSLGDFWADSYMLWGMARKENSKAIEYLPAYRRRFPKMAKILDGVWEE